MLSILTWFIMNWSYTIVEMLSPELVLLVIRISDALLIYEGYRGLFFQLLRLLLYADIGHYDCRFWNIAQWIYPKHNGYIRANRKSILVMEHFYVNKDGRPFVCFKCISLSVHCRRPLMAYTSVTIITNETLLESWHN